MLRWNGLWSLDRLLWRSGRLRWCQSSHSIMNPAKCVASLVLLNSPARMYHQETRDMIDLDFLVLFDTSPDGFVVDA